MLTVVMCGLISLQLATSQASPTARAASAALPPQPSTCTARTTELVFARPAAAGGNRRWARFEVVNLVPGHRPWKTPRGDGVRAAPPLRSSSSGSSARTTGAPTSAAPSRTLAALKATAGTQHRDRVSR
jgi:hypothetical protein